jgi:hypothetical protein
LIDHLSQKVGITEMAGKMILEEVGVTDLGELISRPKVLVEVKRKKETGGTTEGIRTAQKEMTLAARSLVNIWWVEEQTACSSSTCSQKHGLERAEP